MQPKLEDKKQHLTRLLQSNNWTKDDELWLSAYLNTEDLTDLRSIAQKLYDKDLSNSTQSLDEEMSAKLLLNIHAKLNWENPTKQVRSSRKLWITITSAAAILIIGIFIVLFQMDSLKMKDQNKVDLSLGLETDILPAKNTASLTLADGNVIHLRNEEKGVFQDASSFSYTDGKNNEIESQNAQSNKLPKGVRIITTPRGGKYHVVLPDGTKVWLNAATTLKFQSNFLDKDMRYVELDGEAYFQVSKLKAGTGNQVPFLVKSDGQTVKVLGTHFNINAYKSEKNIRTTLLEGAVSVATTSSNQSKLLVPGQQSLVFGQMLTVQQANLEETIAWKEGRFQFDQLDIQGLMRQVERWYDVEVIYEGKIPDKKYVVNISRGLPLHKFLNILSFTGLKFKIEGRKIIVKP